jgi:ADP-heptose:LPS heptosyltransferase
VKAVSDKSLVDFIMEEHERLREQQKQKFGALILRIEENKVYDLVLDLNKSWSRITTRFGERVAIPVIYEDQEYVWMVNPNGSAYRQLVEGLARKLKESGSSRVKEARLLVKKVGNKYSVSVDVEFERNGDTSKKSKGK